MSEDTNARNATNLWVFFFFFGAVEEKRRMAIDSS